MNVFFRIKGKSYDEIITEYGSNIMHVAYSYVKDRQLAEDITQETFIRCFKKGQKFRGDSSIKTWLYRIAINICKDHLKNSYTRKVTVHNEIDQYNEKKVASAENMVMEQIEQETITDYVLALPIEYREIIILHYFKEFKVKVISETLNLSENTVKTRLRRSRELLKERMCKDER